MRVLADVPGQAVLADEGYNGDGLRKQIFAQRWKSEYPRKERIGNTMSPTSKTLEKSAMIDWRQPSWHP